MNLGQETEQVEFKKSTSELREACASIAAILNKHGSGTLYFGVAPNGDVCGQAVAESTLRKISQAISNKVEPAVRPVIEALSDGEGHEYVRVSFKGSEAPYQSEGRYRIRQADEDLIMSSADVMRFAAGALNRADPWDGRSSGRPLSDVVSGVVERYVAEGNQCGRIQSRFASDEDALARLGLLAEDGMLTNAAAELFCASPAKMRLKMGVVGSRDRVNIMDLRHEDGPMLGLIELAEYYVLSNIRRRIVINGAPQREEIPEIPRQAVREALVNAFCHRNYSSPGSCVVVEIFADTVEITNPGLFPADVTPEDCMAGAVVSGEGRNPSIAKALFRGGYTEAFGTGLPRMKASCDEAGVSLLYRQEFGCTKVVFGRPDPFAAAASSQKSELSPLAGKAMETLRVHGPSTAAEAAEVLGCSKRHTQRVLKELADAGLATKEREGNSVHWRLLA